MSLDSDLVAEALPNYEVGGELGRGGMGIVLGGRHRTLGRSVAIKQLPRAFAADPAVRARFLAEARVLASLSHPHIVPIYDFVERDGLCLLVMEALPGGSVWTRFTGEGFTPETTCSIVMASLAGLHYAHARGVLHRDMKPDNLMFADDGVAKVTDFGIAKVVGGNETYATQAGEVIGTPAYMAPEQAQGKELTPATDVYAVGVMFYELLAGTLPYSEEGDALAIVYRHVYEDPVPLLTVAPSVPAPLAGVAMHSLARSVDDRYQTAEDFAVAIGEAATIAWGVGWLDRAEVPLMAPGRILASTERPTAPAGEAPATAAPAPGTYVMSQTPSPAAPTVVPEPAPPTVVPAAAPRVRPSVAMHVAGANADAVAVADLVPVHDVIEPPPIPRAQLLIAAVLIVITVVVGFVGLGSTSYTDTLGAGAVTVAGVDAGSSSTIKLDLSKPVPITVKAGGLGAPDHVQVELSTMGIPLGKSSNTALQSSGDTSSASVDLKGSRYLVAGTVTGKVVLEGEGRVTGTQEFPAQSTQSGVLTVPFALAVILLLVVLSFAESTLRPLRRGRRKAGAPVIMAIIGAGFGIAAALLGCVLASTDLTIVTLAVCAVLGAGAGVAAALAATMLGRRRRLQRRAARANA